MLAAVTIAVLSLGACGDAGEGSSPRATAQGWLSEDAAADALAEARDRLVDDSTGGYRHRIAIGDGTDSSSTPTMEHNGRFDLARERWAQTSTFEDVDPATDQGTIEMVGTTTATYLTATGWQAKNRGRWMKMTEPQMAEIGGSLQGGEPFAVRILRDADATGGERSEEGTIVRATVSPESALTLINLQSAFIKEGLDPTTLAGEIDVTVELGKDGDISSIAVERVGLESLADQLPPTLAEGLSLMEGSVTYDKLGEPVTIDVPRDDQLVDPSVTQL